MKIIIFFLIVITLLCGCGFVGVMDHINERYMQPRVIDLSVQIILDSYQFNFLNKYNIKYQWPASARACKIEITATLNADWGIESEFFNIPDIFEKDNHTWQASAISGKFNDLDKYVGSVKAITPIYGYEYGTRQEIGEEEHENGFQPLCDDSNYLNGNTLLVRLSKRDLKMWKVLNTQYFPKGKWTEKRVGNNIWTIQEDSEHEFAPAKLNATGGLFQSWLLPIGDSDYTLAIELGASKESLQKPEGHARINKMFRQMIEAVKIEPIQP